MTRNVTLKDVAKRAGVSYQTVSKILRNQIQVTPEVFVRVQAAVEELGYHPNAAARNLRTQSSRLIGYSWQPDRQHFVNPILEQFQQSIVETAESLGYHILLFPQRANVDLETTYTELIQTGRVDGFVLSGMEYDDPRIPVIQGLNVPFVSFGRSNPEYNIPYVDVDGRAGIYQAMQHLLAQGHRKIAALGWPQRSRVGEDRLSGYLDAMADAGIPLDSDWIKRGESEFDYGYNAMCELLDLPPERRPTAVVTTIDIIAVGAMNAIDAYGLRVGPDVAVVGFDDMPFVHYLKPGLTSVRQPVWEIGTRLIHILVALLAGETPDEQQILLTPELVIRESSVGYHPSYRSGQP